MIRLTIDGQDVPVDQKSNVSITASIAEIEDPESTSSGYSKSVEVPFTPQSMRVFGFVNELYSKEQFNNALHTAEYIEDDVVVMSGVAQMEKVSYTPGAEDQTAGGAFHVSVIGASFDWITSAKKQMNELQSDEVVKYLLEDVYANSVRPNATLIKFFPIDRGAFWKENANGESVPRNIFNLYDYHPFINVWKLLLLIFNGYIIKSSIGALLQKLYCSGCMPAYEDMSYIEDENDFHIGSSITDAVDVGYIGVNNQFIRSNLLYDSWESDEYYNSNKVIAMSNILGGFPKFTPTTAAVMRLQTNLHYSTKIMNGSSDGIWNDILEVPGECLYVDKFQQHVGGNVETITLTLDQCEDAKKNKQGDISNVFIPADEAADRTYVVYMRCNCNGESRIRFNYSGNSYWIGSIKHGDNWYVVNAPKAKGGGHFEIQQEGSPQPSEAYLTDFYYFEITNNEVVFEMEDVTKNAYTVQKETAHPIYGVFSFSRKYGILPGEARVSLSLCKNNSIKPTFQNVIGLGDNVDISTIGGASTQLEFLSAFRQMFNLMFYANPVTREVFIEPRTAFFNMDRADILDWCYKIDYSKPVEVQELGGDAGNTLKLSYADGGDVVQRYNWKNRTNLGAWRTPLLNKTSDEVKEITNPMFAPFLTRSVASVGMTIPQNEPEKTQDMIEEVDLNITPIIGYFAGVADRTAGDDLLQWPKYPRLVFQDAEQHINLGFGDLSGVTGLHQYYKDNISAYNYGRRITLYLHLEPQDVEAMQMPSSIKYDMRAVFLLRINGEDAPCLLEKIEDYKPGGGASIKCQFISDPHIRLTGKELVAITYNGEAIAYRNKVITYRPED